VSTSTRFKPYPETKDSGIEWLGRVPAHWKSRRLKCMASINLSNVDKKTEEGQEPVHLCNYVDVYKNESITSDMDFMVASATQEQIRRFALQADDVLITKDSESWDDIAVPACVEADMPDVLCGYHLALIRPDRKSDMPDVLCGYHLALIRPDRKRFVGRYVARAFASVGLRDQFWVAANGITRFGLTGDAIRAGWFPVPPYDEQKAIADFLDRETAKIDTLVEKKERLIELLQEKRTALITHAVTEGLDPNVPMKDSGIEWLGEIPEHWKAVPFKTLLARNDSGVWGEDPNGVADTVVLRSTEQKSDGSWCIADPASRSLSHRERAEAILVNEDLVVTKSSGSQLHIGKTSYVDEHVGSLGACFSNFMQRLRVKEGNTARLFWRFMNSPACRQQFVYLSTTTTGLGNLNGGIIGAVWAPVAPTDEQRAIADFLDRETAKIDALIAKVGEAIERLKEYRTALISAAVTGKIDVRGYTASEEG